MSTVNIILMAVLCIMIGFAIGNIYGQAKMKATFNHLISQVTNGLKSVREEMNNAKGEAKKDD